MNNKKKIAIIALIFTIIILINVISLGVEIPSSYNPHPEEMGDTGRLGDITSIILGVITVIGIFVAVGGLSIIGIKTMFGSAQEKSEYKQKLPIFIVGLVVLVTSVAIVNYIYMYAKNISNVGGTETPPGPPGVEITPY